MYVSDQPLHITTFDVIFTPFHLQLRTSTTKLQGHEQR